MTKQVHRVSVGDRRHPYEKPSFWANPSNQFWNNKEFLEGPDKNGFTERVLASSPKAKQYFEECLKARKDKKSQRTQMSQ